MESIFAILLIAAVIGTFIYMVIMTRGGCLLALAFVLIVFLLIKSSPVAFFILLVIVGSILAGLH